MIKQRKLKKWVINTLLGINFISLLIMGSESNNLSVFIIGHIIAVALFLLSGYILLKNDRD